MAPACIVPAPPVNPGFVSLAPSQRKAVEVGGELLGGYATIGPVGGGTLHLEPFAGERLSVPIDVTSYFPGFGALRVGPRFRLLPRVALGGGVGAFTAYGSKRGSGVTTDLELVTGRRFDTFALSMGVRPAVSIPVLDPESSAFWLPVEIAPAFVVGPSMAVTLHVMSGLAVGHDMTAWFVAGGIGVHWGLPSPNLARSGTD